ncbi:DUF2975 domain-containing protein [Bacteroides oleiciplenus]|uniref:DUF2975 domain-containing protein n=1 Tax=Bacteroides oleiciplenus TaxID=626931 RepID=A0A3E5B9S7_9BACE|nr:DUF2975 domain-containing protein [Bacteroides oleiciplenus]RGN34293.1 DUF2975 domain-containing protein [Bacteroides oleiciplenus]
MKKFRILGILAMLVIVGDFVISFTAGWQEERDSFLAGCKSARAESPSLYTPEAVPVEVRPLETTNLDSLHNSIMNENLPYKIDKVSVAIVPSTWSSIVFCFGAFAALAILAGIYCLIRVLISISKRNVFTHDNVVRMRVFTYSLLAFSILNALMEWLNYIEVVKQVSLPGYEIKGFSMSEDWVSLVVIVLFTEIFAVGVKMKEEQDLTI